MNLEEWFLFFKDLILLIFVLTILALPFIDLFHAVLLWIDPLIYADDVGGLLILASILILLLVIWEGEYD